MKTVPSVPSTVVDDQIDGDGPTRQRVLAAILAAGPRTAAELADDLGLTPAAVRRHLAVLSAEGLLASRAQRVYGRRGRGRPASVFTLTDLGRGAFRNAYDTFAVQALAQLLDSAGPDAVAELAHARVAPVVHTFRRLSDADPARPSVEVLAEALNEHGYVASARQVSSGVQICQHHCPVAHVAESFPVLCEVETATFADLLGTHVQRLATIAHGDGVCTTHIPRPITKLEATA